jgi:hypothetical protein
MTWQHAVARDVEEIGVDVDADYVVELVLQRLHHEPGAGSDIK